jgi:hypothetical protein
MNIVPEEEIQLSTGMLEKAVRAIEKLSPEFQVLVLPTGVNVCLTDLECRLSVAGDIVADNGIGVWVHLLGNFPFKNNLLLKEPHPDIPEPHRSRLFYTYQHKLLQSLSKGKSWTYLDVRPNIIIGFFPNNNAHNLAQWLALYLTLYRKIYGEGEEVLSPGTKSWTTQSNGSSQDIIDRFAIWASLHPESSAWQIFNVADNSQPISWSVKWPIVCRYFGLKGVAPTDGPGPVPAEFLCEHQDEWLAMEKERGLQTGHLVGGDRSIPYVPRLLISEFDFDRPLDLTKTHQTWGDAKEELDVQGT